MKLKIQKIIRQIKAHEFGKPAEPQAYPSMDPGFRRAVRAPPCIR